MTGRTCVALAAAVLSVLMTAPRIAGQGSPTTSRPAAPPDWSGVYRFARGADLAGFTQINPLAGLDKLIISHLQPWARMKMLATNGVAEDRGAICQMDGLFRQFQGAAGFQWLNAGDKIVLASSMLQVVGVRRIYFSDRHPTRLPFTWLGHSIARWEGDTLVVDTIGFNDKTWLMSAMQPHTEELHIVERIRAVGDGSLLEFHTTIEDRKALTSPYEYSRYYKRTDGEYVESLCNSEPGDARMWDGFRRHALANPPPPGER